MDATVGSNGNGFDAALRALEDLETSVAEVGKTQPAPVAAVAPVIAPVSAPDPDPVLPVTSSVLAFDEAGQDDAPVAIAAIPLAEVAPGQPLPPLAVPAELPAPEAAHAATAAAPAPAGAPVMVPAPGPGRWTKVAIGLGLASSVVSAAGLIIAERTIMSAQLVVATARERQEQLEQANRLIHDLQLVRDRQVELLKAQQAQLASAPVTSAELQHRMDVLQEGIMKREPVAQVIEALHASQSDINSRLGDLGMKIDRIGHEEGR